MLGSWQCPAVSGRSGGPLGRTHEPLSNHCPGLTCLQRSGWSQCFSLPSHPGETPGSNGDGRRPLPRRSPSSSKALFLLAAHQAISAISRAWCRRMRSTRSEGISTRPQGLSKSLVGKGRIKGDPIETLWSAGTRPMLELRRLHVLDDSYDCLVSSPRSTVRFQTKRKRGQTATGMARPAAHATRHVRTSRACTVEVEEKIERTGWKRAMSLVWSLFFREQTRILAHTQVGCGRRMARRWACRSLQQMQRKQGFLLHLIDQTTR